MNVGGHAVLRLNDYTMEVCLSLSLPLSFSLSSPCLPHSLTRSLSLAHSPSLTLT